MITFKHEDDERKGKFTILENDSPVGEMTYVWANTDKFIIDHTETYKEYSGKGYGKQLVMKGIEFARRKGVKIIPLCPYAKKVIAADKTILDIV